MRAIQVCRSVGFFPRKSWHFQLFFKDRSLYYSTFAIREQAEIARYNPEERREYEESVKNFWDYYSTVKSALNRVGQKAEQKGEQKENTIKR